MKIKNRLFLSLLLLCVLGFGQNKKEFRESFTLTLAVDSTQYYKQEVLRSPYIPKDDILQIYPGEKLFIEATVVNNQISLIEVVKENLHPDKTIGIDFQQNVNDKENKGMMLFVENPFDKTLKYEALIYIVGQEGWRKTSIIPVRPKLSTAEMWPDVIITLVLHNWRLE